MKYFIQNKNIVLFLLFIFSFSFVRELIAFYIIGDFFVLRLIAGFSIDTFIVFFPLLLFRINIRSYLIFVFIFLSLSNFIATIHLFQYKTPISMGVFAVIAETTSQEVFEFFNIISVSEWIFALFTSFFIFFLLFFLEKRTKFKRIEVLKILITFLLIAISTNTINNFISNNNISLYKSISFNSSNIYQDAKRIAFYYREKRKLLKLNENRSKLKFKVKKDTTKEERIFVLIIGESMSKKHMSLYGYERNTTPLLKKMDSIIVYTNVISPATRTTQSITRVLSKATVRNKTPFYKEPSIISLVKSAGYKTYWISNQQMLGISDTEVTSFAKETDESYFINTDWHTNSLDEKVLPKLENVLKENKNKKFIVIHLLGSHFTYSKRYPPNKMFIVQDDYVFPDYINEQEKKTWKHYDNSILYTDFIVTSIINIIKKENTISNVLFLSDHGEEMYDDKEKVTGHGRSKVKKEVVEIPFFLWNSKKYYKNNVYNNFIQTSSRKYSTENLFYSIADLLKINFSEDDKTKSIFSNKFIFKKRFVINTNQTIISYENIKKN